MWRNHTLVVVALVVCPQDVCQAQIVALTALCRREHTLGARPTRRDGAQGAGLTLRGRHNCRVRCIAHDSICSVWPIKCSPHRSIAAGRGCDSPAGKQLLGGSLAPS